MWPLSDKLQLLHKLERRGNFSPGGILFKFSKFQFGDSTKIMFLSCALCRIYDLVPEHISEVTEKQVAYFSVSP